MMRLAVLITCFNRVETTLRGLRKLIEALDTIANLGFEVFLVDDKSPDGTGAVVKAAFPSITVIVGTGDLFWNRGMCLAFQSAQTRGPFDCYLLFNDDVELILSKVLE